jgi:hypothetical protein
MTESFHEKSPAERLAVIKKCLADEWEKMVTGEAEFSDEEMHYADILRAGGKLPRKHKWVEQKLVRICQDYRLTPDQVDVVLAEIMS